MLYQPTFCCECGEKIERVEWKIWTNRRFCELCETDFTFQNWTLKIIIGSSVIFSVLFIANSIIFSGKSENTGSVKTLKNSSPVVGSGNQTTSTNSTSGSLNQNGTVVPVSPPKGEMVANGSRQIETEDRKNQAEALQNQQNSGALPVYFCGAETKKGSPCSRRVKGGGRCWQHSGQSAMLPESKLLLSQ